MVRWRRDPRPAQQRQGGDHVRRRAEHHRDAPAHAHPRRRPRARHVLHRRPGPRRGAAGRARRSTRTATSSRITRITTTAGVGSTRVIPSSSGRRLRSNARSARARRGSVPRTATTRRSWPVSCGKHGMRMAMWDVSDGNRGDEDHQDVVRRVLAPTRAVARSSTCATASTVHRQPQGSTRRRAPADPRRPAGETPRAGAPRPARRRSRLHVV